MNERKSSIALKSILTLRTESPTGLDPVHSPEEIRESKTLHREYVRKFQGGCKRAASVLACLNDSYCLGFIRKKRFEQFDRDDLLQEGRIGALEGYSEFDLDKYDCGPLTFVRWHIESRIREFAFNRSTSVKLPRSQFALSTCLTFTDMDMSPENVGRDTKKSFSDGLVATTDQQDVQLDRARTVQLVPIVERIVFRKINPKVKEILYGVHVENKSFEEMGRRFGFSKQRAHQLARQFKVPASRPGLSFEDWVARVGKSRQSSRIQKLK